MRAMYFCVLGLNIQLAFFANASTLEEIVAAHESGVAQLHAIDAKYVIEYDNKALPQKKCRWVREGKNERMIVDQLMQNAQGEVNFRSDAHTDGSRYRVMSGPGWDSTTKKIPDGIPLLYVDTTHSDILPEISGPDDFFFAFQIGLNDFRRTLGHYLKEKNAEYIGTKDVSGHLTHHIRLVHPGMVEPATGRIEKAGTIFDVYLDPGEGFLARRVDKTFNLNGTVVKYGSEVRDFLHVGGGISFPRIIEHFKSHLGEEEKRFCRQTTTAVINKALPNDAFDFRFLEGLFVEVRPARGEQEKWLYIGKNGKTDREFANVDDVQAFKDSLKLGSTNSGLRRWTWVILGAIPIVVALLIVLWRRRANRDK